MAQYGDTIHLIKQDVEVIKCDKCGDLMVNVDESDILPGDLRLLKRVEIKVSNPNTDDDICISCDEDCEVKSWYDSDDDDDSSLFGVTSIISPTFGGFNILGSGMGRNTFKSSGGSFGGGGASSKW